MRSFKKFLTVFVLVIGLFTTFLYNNYDLSFLTEDYVSYALEDIPDYAGKPYVVLDDNIPKFDEEDKLLSVFETYGELDSLGRVTVAYAKLGSELMPSDERESISNVTPTGWINESYDFVSGKYLYNRSHLIGFQLSGENANEKNLMTGTRSFNVEGMLPFENMVADYIKETGDRVLYRVTPVYDGNNLVATGVQMEAKSVVDNGDAVLFNVFVYNVQDGVNIDYSTGKSNLIAN